MFVAHSKTKSLTSSSLAKKLASVAILVLVASGFTAIEPAQATTQSDPRKPDWEIQESLSSSLTSVTYNNGAFIAGGNIDGGNILKSTTDGTDWFQPYETSGGPSVNDVASCGDHVVTVGRGRVAWSDETNFAGSGQDPVPNLLDSVSVDWKSVACGEINGQLTWVAVANAEAYAVDHDPNTAVNVITSTDNGLTWTPTGKVDGTNLNWSSVTYGAGKFVAVANTQIYGVGRAMVSTDGLIWHLGGTEENGWTDVTYGKDGQGNDLFVAVANSGYDTRVMTSPDGSTWTPQTPSSVKSWSSITYGNGFFLALASGTMMTSVDGVAWIERFAPVRNWNSVSYGNGVFVAVSLDGGSRQIMKSTYEYTTFDCSDGGSYDVTSHGVATNGTLCNDPSFRALLITATRISETGLSHP